MLSNLPIFIPVFFGLTTVLTIFLFLKSVERPPQYKTVLGVLIGWSVLQMVVSWAGFYQKTDTLPPRFLLAIMPTLLLIIGLFLSKNGQVFIESLDLKALTYLHVVRIPVELTLLWLFQHDTIPEVMTFEGRNFDIISGITAPFVAYFGFTKRTLSATMIIVWNVLCLILLFNVVITAALSVQTPLQQMSFDRPNRAVLFFPFVWLPSVVVPLVLFAHLVVLKRLSKSKVMPS